MNRRNFLRIVPLLPIVALSPATQATAKPVAIDTRPTFKRGDYVIVLSGGTDFKCEIHDSDHGGVWTRGCHPVAFDIEFATTAIATKGHLPVTDDSVPYGLACPVETRPGMYNPHKHNEFRWVD